MKITNILYSICVENKLLICLLSIILCGFFLRIYFTHSGTWEYSRETASKKVTSTILFMVGLALCFETEMISIPISSRGIVEGIIASIYLLISLVTTFNDDDSNSNCLLTFVKFVLVYLLSISNEITAIAISILFAVVIILLYIKEFVNEDSDKITFSEIILLCIENLFLSIGILFFVKTNAPFSVILKVTFEETALYSLNYIILFAVKEKIYSL